MMNYEICMPCKFSQRGCGDGICACLADEQRRDILVLAASGDCPKGYFANPQTMPPRPPCRPDIPLAGDVVERIAKAVGADRLAKFWERITGAECGCAARKAKMNRASERLLRWFGRCGPTDPGAET